MALLQLNIPLVDGAPSPNFEAQYVLDAVTYTIRYKWNARLGAWFATLLDAGAETILMADMRLVVNWPLNAYRSGNKLPGALMVFDTVGESQDPGLLDLGTRHVVAYFTAADT